MARLDSRLDGAPQYLASLADDATLHVRHARAEPTKHGLKGKPGNRRLKGPREAFSYYVKNLRVPNPDYASRQPINLLNPEPA